MRWKEKTEAWVQKVEASDEQALDEVAEQQGQAETELKTQSQYSCFWASRVLAHCRVLGGHSNEANRPGRVKRVFGRQESAWVRS